MASIIVPTDAILGQSVMRVRSASVENMSALEPCGNTENGESEDYTVQVLPSLGVPNSAILKNSIVVFASDKSVNIKSTKYSGKKIIYQEDYRFNKIGHKATKNTIWIKKSEYINTPY